MSVAGQRDGCGFGRFHDGDRPAVRFSRGGGSAPALPAYEGQFNLPCVHAMTICTATHTTESVTHDSDPCKSSCAGVSFSVQSMSTGNDAEGNCTFSWTVARSRGSATDEIADSATVSCGGDKTIEFTCGDSSDCVGFKLHLKCTSS